MTTFYLVRHGQTQWNLQGTVQGHMDSPLTQKGLGQIKTLSEKLRNVEFDKIFSSDLLRAKRTAEIIALEKKMAVETTAALREQAGGKFEGKPLKDLIDAYDWDDLSEEEKFKYKVDDGVESDEESATRLITFLREIAVAYPGKNILIVSHGIVIKALLHRLAYTRYEENLFLDNSGYVVIESDGIDFFVKEVNGVEKNDE